MPESINLILQSLQAQSARLIGGQLDFLLLCSLFLALLALLVALRAGRAGRARSTAPSADYAEVHKAIEEFGKKFASFAERSSLSQAKAEHAIQELRNRVAGLEQTATAVDSLAEKKSPKFEVLERNLEQSTTPDAAEMLEAVSALVQVSEREAAKTVTEGLQKTRNQLFSGFSRIFENQPTIDISKLDQLEELLIMSDLGVATAKRLVDGVRAEAELRGAVDIEELRAILRSSLQEILQTNTAIEIVPAKREGQPLVVMVVGVNGVGKTTTIAKLANRFRESGARVLIGACDTFRAAAVEQLASWAERVGADMERGAENAKPSTVAYQAVHRAQDQGYDVLILDTAGRLHTKVNLMNELANVRDLVAREQAGAPHETLLVLDASTGQNALQQAREFNERTELSGIVVTKLDGTPKGGVVVAIKDELGIPIRYIGVGEGLEDLKKFSAEEFTNALLSNEGVGVSSEDSESNGESAHAKVRRSRRRAAEGQL